MRLCRVLHVSAVRADARSRRRRRQARPHIDGRRTIGYRSAGPGSGPAERRGRGAGPGRPRPALAAAVARRAALVAGVCCGAGDYELVTLRTASLASPFCLSLPRVVVLLSLALARHPLAAAAVCLSCPATSPSLTLLCCRRTSWRCSIRARCISPRGPRSSPRFVSVLCPLARRSSASSLHHPGRCALLHCVRLPASSVVWPFHPT